MKQLTIDQQKRAIAKLKKLAFSKDFQNKLRINQDVYNACIKVLNKPGINEEYRQMAEETKKDAYQEILRLNSFKDHIIHVKSDFERLS